jgi:dolichol-phosphate mannosyltransferase
MTELAVIIPTLNERQNVKPIVERLTAALKGLEWEVIFVDDDSADGTTDECRRLAALNPHVRVIQRIGRRGLASACLEGMLASTAPYVAVMDGDMQHDEAALPRMLEAAKTNHADVVVGSRHAEGGGIGSFAKERVWLSNLGRRFSRAVCSHDLSDPMSGFFLLNRNYLDKVVRRVSGVGFKILLDLIAYSTSPIKIVEVPYVFRTRIHGESKLDLTVGFEYFVLLADKILGRTIPLSFALFSIVGTVGVLLHLLVLTGLRAGSMSFLNAQLIATAAAMISNFFLNNLITYRTTRLRGWLSIGKGLLGFCGACSLGAISNLAVAKLLVDHHVHWILAGVAGILFGSVWNYSVTAVMTWHIGQTRARRRMLTTLEASAPLEVTGTPA